MILEEYLITPCATSKAAELKLVPKSQRHRKWYLYVELCIAPQLCHWDSERTWGRVHLLLVGQREGLVTCYSLFICIVVFNFKIYLSNIFPPPPTPNSCRLLVLDCWFSFGSLCMHSFISMKQTNHLVPDTKLEKPHMHLEETEKEREKDYKIN